MFLFMKRIACINTKSGNISDCHFLMRCLKEHLGPQNVFDLSLVTPLQVLEECSPDQILCCGGDGTVAWILSSLDEFVFVGKRPVIGVIPLGTGNDLVGIEILFCCVFVFCFWFFFKKSTKGSCFGLGCWISFWH